MVTDLLEDSLLLVCHLLHLEDCHQAFLEQLLAILQLLLHEIEALFVGFDRLFVRSPLFADVPALELFRLASVGQSQRQISLQELELVLRLPNLKLQLGLRQDRDPLTHFDLVVDFHEELLHPPGGKSDDVVNRFLL